MPIALFIHSLYILISILCVCTVDCLMYDMPSICTMLSFMSSYCLVYALYCLVYALYCIVHVLFVYIFIILILCIYHIFLICIFYCITHEFMILCAHLLNPLSFLFALFKLMALLTICWSSSWLMRVKVIILYFYA